MPDIRNWWIKNGKMVNGIRGCVQQLGYRLQRLAALNGKDCGGYTVKVEEAKGNG